MLNSASLKKDLKSAIEDTFKEGFYQAMKGTLGSTSDAGDKMCKDFSDRIVRIIADPLAERFAEAIDAYVKNANIFGTIVQPFVSAGSPHFHTGVFTCPIMTSPVGLGGGSIPNTFGIT